MTLLAFVDATYRPIDLVAGFGYMIRNTHAGKTVSVSMGTKRIPFLKQGSSQVEMTAIHHVIEICSEEFRRPPDVIFTDAQGVVNKFDKSNNVKWVRRDTAQIQMVHKLARQLTPSLGKPPPSLLLPHLRSKI